jgi:hypothetical protein
MAFRTVKPPFAARGTNRDLGIEDVFTTYLMSRRYDIPHKAHAPHGGGIWVRYDSIGFARRGCPMKDIDIDEV